MTETDLEKREHDKDQAKSNMAKVQRRVVRNLHPTLQLFHPPTMYVSAQQDLARVQRNEDEATYLVCIVQMTTPVLPHSNGAQKPPKRDDGGRDGHIEDPMHLEPHRGDGSSPPPRQDAHWE